MMSSVFEKAKHKQCSSSTPSEESSQTFHIYSVAYQILQIATSNQNYLEQCQELKLKRKKKKNGSSK